MKNRKKDAWEKEIERRHPEVEFVRDGKTITAFSISRTITRIASVARYEIVGYFRLTDNRAINA